LKKLWIVFLISTLLGCAATTTEIDSFDGSTIVRQEPFVLTSAKFGIPGTQLGFRWKNKVQDMVALDVGFSGIESVRKVAFNMDGNIYEINKPLHTFTEFESGGRYPGWSFNSFAMPLSTFKQLAKAQSVKMKVTNINGYYTVGEFGRKKSMKYIDQSGHFDKFLSQVNAQLKK